MENYSPDEFKIVFDGIKVDGLAKGTFITGGRVNNVFDPYEGSQGDIARVQNLSQLGLFKLTLMQGSPTNTRFAQRVMQDEQVGTLTGPFRLVDLRGLTYAKGEIAWLVKPADIERSNEYATVEWSIQIQKLEIFPGGALLT
jgi:hypothetical protein